ncbi:tetratricopeptide repeat protein (plasmid) [Kitasatospora herbaricolor]|uniref:tetratricopeptide repeat protein n=1 Tax=Kitasatospora herbaricolor TaxID=68217 RepID=UPI002E2F7F0A|nr:tetratricopeptide repeat protein [Kitasatospora herbaricolor]
MNGLDGPGSGYVIAPSLVLTSAHVTPDVGGTVTVYRPGRPGTYAARTVWRGTPGGVDDAALLLVDDTAWTPMAWAGVRWGRLVTTLPGTACETWGIPNLVQRKDRATDTLHPSGTLNPGDRDVGNRYVMNLGEHPPDAREDGQSPWGGISGGALFCGDLLTGVITSDPAGRAHAALEAVPAYVLLSKPAFRTALAEHTPHAGTVLEAAEWQHLAESPDAPAGGAGSPAALLRARRQAVPFRGRSDLIDALTTWCRQPGFGAHLVHGPGGQGKTRLADHLAGLLAAEKYAVLWMRANASGEDLEVLASAAKPLLVVVDYAETRTPQLLALLEAARRHPGTTSFKVLLLARTPGDWWTALQDATPTAEDLLDGSGNTLLDPLEPDAGTSRTQAYHEALDGYAGHLNRLPAWQNHDWPAITGQLQTRELEAGALAGALTLHMTALADLLDAAAKSPPDAGPGMPQPGGTQGVEDRLLSHERRYWTNTAAARELTPALTMATLTDALAAAFLLGADNRAQADALLLLVPGLADQNHDRRTAVRTWITALYPPAISGQVWDSLQPDRLTERFIGRHLTQHPELPHHLVTSDTSEAQAAQCLTVYTRAAGHTVFDGALDQHLTALITAHPSMLAPAGIDTVTRTEHPEPLLEALQEITGTVSLAQLEMLGDRLPHFSHALAPGAAELAERLVSLHRQEGQAEPDTYRPRLAMSLNNLANRLGDLGRLEEALTAGQEAVDAYRELAHTSPDRYRPDLAMSLNNLANRLRDLGRYEEALTAGQEALDAYRELAHTRPDTYRPDLASSLNNLAIQLGDLGRYEKALAAGQEALDIRRELAHTSPDTYRPDLASSLNNLANRLGDLGRPEEALTAGQEAVDAYRELAHTSPDTYRPRLAMSLNNLANRLGDLGRYEKALTVGQEAVDIRRALARTRPDTYRPRLAGSLNNLAVQLADLGRYEEALTAVQEAVDTYRELAHTRPDTYRPDLAGSLNNLAIQLADLGRYEKALTAVQEALDTYRELAHTSPDRYRPDLAMSLNNHANRLGDLGRYEKALTAGQEALDIRRELARTRPDAHRPRLAMSLNNLAVQLADLGRYEEALTAVQEAVDTYRELAHTRPDTYRPDLAGSLNNLANRLGDLGRYEKALTAVQEAVDLYEGLALLLPTAYEADLQTALTVRSLLQKAIEEDS